MAGYGATLGKRSPVPESSLIAWDAAALAGRKMLTPALASMQAAALFDASRSIRNCPMLKLLRRLMSPRPGRADSLAIEHWADDLGYRFMRVRGVRGWVVEGQQGAQSWRIEWGASQRAYIEGMELRIIAEVGLPKGVVAVVLNRSLLAVMEKTVYDQFIGDVQTRIDTDTPPEMRWLVMYPQLSVRPLGRLHPHYGAAGNDTLGLQQWLAGPLEQALANSAMAVGPDQPVVLAVGRGRMTLRTPMSRPDVLALAIWLPLFEQALRAVARLGAGGTAADGPMEQGPADSRSAGRSA